MNGPLPPSYGPHAPLPPYQPAQLPPYTPPYSVGASLAEQANNPQSSSFFQKKFFLPLLGILSWLGYFLFLQAIGNTASTFSFANISIPTWGAVLLSFGTILSVILCFTGFIAITFLSALPQEQNTKFVFFYAFIIASIALGFWGIDEGIHYLTATLLFGGVIRIWFQTQKLKEKFVRVEIGMMLPRVVGEFMLVLAIMLGIMSFSVIQNVMKDGTDAPIVQTVRTKLGLVGALVAFGSVAAIDETTTVGQLADHLANPNKNQEPSSSTDYPFLNVFQPITTAIITDAGAVAQKGISAGILRTFGGGKGNESTPLSEMMGSFLLDGVFTKVFPIFQGISLIGGVVVFLAIRYVAGWVTLIVSLLVSCITFFCKRLGFFETKQETRVVERMVWL